MLKLFYMNRNKVLTFQTPQTKAKIFSLAQTHVSDWDMGKLILLYILDDFTKL